MLLKDFKYGCKDLCVLGRFFWWLCVGWIEVRIGGGKEIIYKIIEIF